MTRCLTRKKEKDMKYRNMYKNLTKNSFLNLEQQADNMKKGINIHLYLAITNTAKTKFLK